MKQFKTIFLGLALITSTLLPLTDANAWVAAGGYHGAVVVGGYHPAYYHPAYHPAGCYGCGAAAGAVAGMAVGAAIASAARPPTVVVQQPATVYVQQPTYVAQGYMPIGTQMASLPDGSRSMIVNGINYYQYGATWYQPLYGSSGVYYQVVPAP
jgi:hypothetical protein